MENSSQPLTQTNRKLFLDPPLPKPQIGKKYEFNQIIGSADAALIAQHAEIYRENFSVLIVICSNFDDLNRLYDEIALFNSSLIVRKLPDWEILPYDHFSPHQDLISERLETLHRLNKGDCDVLLLSVSTFLQRMSPPQFISSRTFFFKQGEKINQVMLRNKLQEIGYDPVSAVIRPGEYSIRGGLIDLFPMGSNLPYRIDLFDDEIENIKTFDPDTQRSLFPVKEIKLLPGHEFPFDEAARKFARGKWREYFEGDPSKCSMYKDLAQGIASPGIEFYLPLFFDRLESIVDYFPKFTQSPWIWIQGDIQESISSFWENVTERHKFLSHDVERPIVNPNDIFINEEQFFSLIKPYPRVTLKNNAIENDADNKSFLTIPTISINRKSADSISLLRQFSSETKYKIVICADTPGRRETIKDLIDNSSFLPSTNILNLEFHAGINEFISSGHNFGLIVAPIYNGFISASLNSCFISEYVLFFNSESKRKRSKKESSTNIDSIVRDLSELNVGDPVVHSEHGIGRYQGLILIDTGQGDEEFLFLNYANSASLYVPVQQIHLISRYAGSDPEHAPLHNLGSEQWEKARKKASDQIRDTAAELLNIYALRSIRKGHAFEFSRTDYTIFCEGFGFEETPDQLSAISAVIEDMTSGKPMDRLICGDVGFGKTEVALRASFVAVMGGKQVAILCPTTLLAEQHANTWRDRMANWPVKIVEISRFQSTKEVNTALKAIENGNADIVIGTHKILTPELNFKRLGLLIIDEEHRFGVRQKEALKSLRSDVDILTLTATPIPRTLGMALEGIRELSVIATAPQKRLSIKTFLRREGEGIIRESVLREIKRGGQVYFLHNQVETIENRRLFLERVVPEARIGIAHGQLPERELEKIMHDFVSKKINLLLCSTIIETGIDVPSANTIIIHRADKFGLAQLHQLRGRVGRSHHQAYAYLLVPDPEALSKQAKLRLDAIQAMEELGSGFYLAMHDLEIRGAGEVLGDKQSGEIHEIGFQLYSEMLNRAVKDLKNGKEPDLLTPMHQSTEISLGVPALLPSDYCPDVHERLSIYKKLALSTDNEHINLIFEELIDRFGKIPDKGLALIETHRLRLGISSIGIKKLDASNTSILLQFIPNPPIDPLKIIKLIQNNPSFKLFGQDRLKITPSHRDDFSTLTKRIEKIKQTIAYLENY